jgi:alanine racemase
MAVTSASELEIDLDAIAENWRRLDAKHKGATAAVLKADAYGLGAKEVAPKLVAAGCQNIFTAHLGEALEIRDLIHHSSLRAQRSNPVSVPTATQSGLRRYARNDGGELPMTTHAPMLAVLHGILPGEEETFYSQNVTPALCSLHDIALWRAEAARREQILTALLHIDTGMSRTGLSPAEFSSLRDDMSQLDGIAVGYVMTHLVSAEIPADPINQAQLARFRAAKSLFPSAGASIANSSGSFLGEHFTADLTRPGAALYGVNPTPGAPNPMRPVIRLTARILQIRDIAAGETVGYNGIWTAQRPSRIATVAVGYADGFLRSLSNTATARFESIEIPLAGRVSMDLTTYDITDAPHAEPGDSLELIGPGHDVDALAIEAGTNGYEILTSLGRRYHRHYKEVL